MKVAMVVWPMGRLPALPELEMGEELDSLSAPGGLPLFIVLYRV